MHAAAEEGEDEGGKGQEGGDEGAALGEVTGAIDRSLGEGGGVAASPCLDGALILQNADRASQASQGDGYTRVE